MSAKVQGPKVKAVQRRSNALANDCRGKGAEGCVGTSFSEGDVYIVATGAHKGDSRVASGYCHPCAKRVKVAHHRDATPADLKVKAYVKVKADAPKVDAPKVRTAAK